MWLLFRIFSYVCSTIVMASFHNISNSNYFVYVCCMMLYMLSNTDSCSISNITQRHVQTWTYFCVCALMQIDVLVCFDCSTTVNAARFPTRTLLQSSSNSVEVFTNKKKCFAVTIFIEIESKLSTKSVWCDWKLNDLELIYIAHNTK